MSVINVFLDADGTLVDFESAAAAAKLPPAEFKLRPGAYLHLEFYPEARSILAWLKHMDRDGHVKTWIATKPPTDNPYAASEKIIFFQREQPWLRERIIVTPDKSVLGGPGDILVDDRPHKANASQFKGTLIHFNPQQPMTAWREMKRVVQEQMKSHEMLVEMGIIPNSNHDDGLKASGEEC